MPATPITNPAVGESLVGTEPQLQQQVDPGWRRRLNLFTGRALSTVALDSEQIYRGGLLGTLGQSVTPGTVTGLALTLQAAGADAELTLTPGYGIAASGIDVALNRTLRTSLSKLTVLNPAAGLLTEQVTDLEDGSISTETLTLAGHMQTAGNTTYAGVLLLLPVVAQVSGQALDTGTPPIVVSGNLAASCGQDPSEYAFEDWQIADAVQLVYLPWPAGVPGLSLPVEGPAPGSATWRNRLAYTIFEAESLLGPDDQFPWAMQGVPVGLIAFDPGIPWTANTAYTVGQFVIDTNGYRQQVTVAGTSGAGEPAAWSTAYGIITTDGGVTWQNVGIGWNPLFVDCSAVVRAGGLPRRRSVLPSQALPLELWQANSAFATGDFIVDGNNNVQLVRTAGSSGALSPTWSTTYGQSTADGGVVWINNGPGSWRANTAFQVGQFIFDGQGFIQYVTVAGTSGTTPPTWAGVYLQTLDGSVTWVNNGAGAQPIVQPALAQARINQLSEQLSQAMAQQVAFNTLADLFPTLPPSGILPAAAVNFKAQQATWLPPNWSVSAAPVRLEELEAVLQTGMLEGLLNALPSAPANAALLEPVELLVPLPDAVYDPNILVVPTVAAAFTQAVDSAVTARNLTLQQMDTVQEELNVLFTAIGPNLPTNGNLVDPDSGLTPQELAGRNTLPPYTPAPSETFGTALPATWKAALQYPPGAIVIDDNGAIQAMQNAAATSSGATDPPAWNTTVGGTTTDGAITWLNNGSWSWQPDTAYVVGQFVVDAAGVRHNVTVAGTSASEPPSWNDTLGGTTNDGIVWQAAGQAIWQPDTAYTASAAGTATVILDARGNIQSCQTGGISGDFQPSWNPNLGQTTQDSGVTWVNLGAARWAPSFAYAAGQAILDASGAIQLVQVGGTSGATTPVWNEGASGAPATTVDAAIVWNYAGPLTWQANQAYGAGAIVIDANNQLQWTQAAGTSGATAPAWNTVPGGTTNDNTATWTLLTFASTDLIQLQSLVAAPPYTSPYVPSPAASTAVAAAVKADPTNPAVTPTTTANVTLLSATDLSLLAANGLQSLITTLNARIAAANDLLDTAFLTTQTDIYRYRQNVLGAAAATSLATSPVLANLATGVTATATAADLQSYVATLLAGGSSSAGTSTPAASSATASAASTTNTASAAQSAAPTPAASNYVSALPRVSARSVASFSNIAALKPAAVPAPAAAAAPVELTATVARTSTLTSLASTVSVAQRPILKLPSILGSDVFETARPVFTALSPTSIVSATPATVVSSDVTGQSPLVGAQLNVRTLTIAERLAPPPSQEAMFYSIANRLSCLAAVQNLATQSGFVIDDIPIQVDAPVQTTDAASTAGTTPVAVAIDTYNFRDLSNSTLNSTILAGLQNPTVSSDAAEAELFSVGVRVVEQHTMMLRALEARVQEYTNLVGVCNTALTNMQNDIQQARTYLTQLGNNLLQERQNVAFTSALLGDETVRVANLAAQRQQVLANSVQIVAYTRARTLEATDTVPCRQLVPANIENPVPACLQQSVSIPPELREIVGQLREAPITWLPAVAAQLPNLQRPSLIQQLALSTQARATLQLQSAVLPSSAAGEPGVYAAAIAKIYTANTQVFRGYQVQRAAIQPANLVNMSWSLQVANVQSIAAVNDLISSEAVHAEVSNRVSRLVQQISSVATCLYTRVSIALPADRLAWAEYLRGPGLSVGLSSLAILPNWNSLEYSDRQQMQMLIDWMFQQIDNSNSAALSYMSDVARTAILLASDVPIDTVIPTTVIARIQPTLGATVTLGLPSDRVSAGMYVQLYSGVNLAARGVVSDLDSNTVTATVTDVFKNNVYLETTDVAHVTAQTPQAVALRPLFT